MDTIDFAAKKAELLDLVKKEPTAFADRDGLTPLQQRTLANKEGRFADLVLEEELCAELYMDILELNDAQIDRFVKFALGNDFPGHCLRRRFDQTYIQVRALDKKPDLSAVSYVMLMVLVARLGEYKPTPGEILNNELIRSIKDEGSGLFLELLLLLDDPAYYEKEFTENYGTRYDYAQLAFGADLQAIRKYGINSVERVFSAIKDKLAPQELKWREEFIKEHKV